MNDKTDKSKLSRKTIKDSKKLFSPLVDRMIDAVAIINRDGTILFANKAMAKLIGIESHDDYVGLNMLDFTDPAFHNLFMKDIHLVKTDKGWTSSHYSVYKMKTSTGEEKWVEGISALLYFRGNSAVLITLVDITLRKQAEEALKKREEELINKTRMLEEINTTLRVLLKHREEDKKEIEEKVSANIKDLVMPYVEMMKRSQLDTKTRECITILESNLQNITSPFPPKVPSHYLKLTPKEILIANLIKEGKTTKEMAGLLNITSASIDTHRNSIRNKFGINDKKISLRTYLLSDS